MPNIQISMLAIGIAVVAHFILGYIWFTPLFGKAWAKEVGITKDTPGVKSAMMQGMVFMLIGNFLMAWVLSHNMAAWNPISWGLPPSEISPTVSALMAATYTWLGFYFPVDLGSVAWEMKSWKLFCITTGYHLAALVVVALILANF